MTMVKQSLRESRAQHSEPAPQQCPRHRIQERWIVAELYLSTACKAASPEAVAIAPYTGLSSPFHRKLFETVKEHIW